MPHRAPHAAPHAAPEDQPQALRLAADVWRAVRGHWRVMALFFVLANAAVLGGIMVCPRTYVSEAAMKMNEGRETAALDPTAQVTNNVIAAQANREQDLNTAVDILESRKVMELAVARIGPEPILKGFVPADGEVGDDAGGMLDPEEAQRVDPGPLALIGLSDPVSRFEKAVQTLNEIVEVDSNKKSDVIRVSVKAEKPKLAQRICGEVVAAFRQLYRQASEIEGSSEFFAAKAQRAAAELSAASDELARLKNELGISSVESRRQELNEALARLGATLLERDQQLTSSVALLREYDAQLASTPRQIAAGETRNQATGAPDTLRGQIAVLQADREKAAKYGSASPKVRELDKRIAAMNAALKTVAPQSLQTATAPNPTFQTLESARANEVARAEGLRAEVKTLGDQLADVHRHVATLNENESAILALEAERDQLSQSHRKYIENREQTRVTDQMAAQQISSVRVYQEPTFNAKPVAPKKRLIAAAGLMFAAFGALGLALVLEYKSVFFPPADAAGEGAAGPHAADPYGTPPVGGDARGERFGEVPPAAEPAGAPEYAHAAAGPADYGAAGYGAADTLSAGDPDRPR